MTEKKNKNTITRLRWITPKLETFDLSNDTEGKPFPHTTEIGNAYGVS